MTTAEKKEAKRKLASAEYFAKIMTKIGDRILVRGEEGLMARFTLHGWRNGYMQDDSGYEYHPIHARYVNGFEVGFDNHEKLLDPVLQLIKQGYPDFLLTKSDGIADYELRVNHALPLPTRIKTKAKTTEWEAILVELWYAAVETDSNGSEYYVYKFSKIKLKFLEVI